MMRKNVVVTGIGVVSSMGRAKNGSGVEAFWNGIVSGRNTAGHVAAFDTSAYSTHIACEAPFAIDDAAAFTPANPDRLLSGRLPTAGNTKEQFVASRQSLQNSQLAQTADCPRWLAFLDVAYQEAIADAKINPSSMNTGLFIGTVLGGILEGQRAWADNKPLQSAYHLYTGANFLKARYHITGPALTLSTACASGTDAVGMALRAIRWGKADMAIAGGVDTLSAFAFSGFSSLRALAKDAIRPFDKGRDGLLLGEGAAILVLENQETATKRGARIYGKVMGYASRADGRHLTAPDKEARSLAAAIRAALNDAELSQVGYINAHGTGTLYNDAMETRAIKLAFGKAAYEIPISSIKSMLGHSFGAGGALEAAACLLAIKNNIMPPTINYTTPDPDCDLDYIPNTARRGHVGTALSLSAGFGGQNAAIIFGEES